jgi:putative SOS response-associated peptidase YedK
MATSIAAMFARHVRAVHADDAVEAMQRVFGFTERPNLPPRYNIAPRQEVPIVRRTRDGAGRELILVRWGYGPKMSRSATGRSMPALKQACARLPSARRTGVGAVSCQRTGSSSGARRADYEERLPKGQTRI